MNEDEITKLKLIICNLDLSVATKEKLYNQAHKIRNQLQQKENIIKEVRDLFYEKCRIKDSDGRYSFNETDIDEFRNLLDKENKND